MSNLLVVDDEQAICWGLSKMGKSLGYEVTIASSAERALEVAAEVRPDVIVLDVRLPGMDGLAAIARLREEVGTPRSEIFKQPLTQCEVGRSNTLRSHSILSRCAMRSCEPSIGTRIRRSLRKPIFPSKE